MPTSDTLALLALFVAIVSAFTAVLSVIQARGARADANAASSSRQAGRTAIAEAMNFGNTLAEAYREGTTEASELHERYLQYESMGHSAVERADAALLPIWNAPLTTGFKERTHLGERQDRLKTILDRV